MLMQIPNEDLSNMSIKSFRLCIAHSVLDEINMQIAHLEFGTDHNMVSFNLSKKNTISFDIELT